MGRLDSRTVATREAILSVAERLFAEEGIFNVSNRQISEAAGQGNNAAVGYHFGTKTQLLAAISRRHGEPMERLRAEHVAAAGDSEDLRTWIGCMVRPTTEHLDHLGAPTWFARFSAQVMADPTMRRELAAEMSSTPALRRASDQLFRCLPALPDDVLAERQEITRNVVLQTCADRERALATGGPTPRKTWDDAATGLIDALAGMWTATVTESRPSTGSGNESTGSGNESTGSGNAGAGSGNEKTGSGNENTGSRN